MPCKRSPTEICPHCPAGPWRVEIMSDTHSAGTLRIPWRVLPNISDSCHDNRHSGASNCTSGFTSEIKYGPGAAFANEMPIPVCCPAGEPGGGAALVSLLNATNHSIQYTTVLTTGTGSTRISFCASLRVVVTRSVTAHVHGKELTLRETATPH